MTYDRVRSQGSFQKPFTNSITRTLCNGSNVNVSSGPVGIEVGTTKTTMDMVVPKFHSRVERGEIFNNPFYSVTTEKEGSAVGALFASYVPSCSGTGTKTETQTLYISGGSDYYPVPWTSRDSNRSNAVKLAGTQALANVLPPDVTGLVELAELSKTLALVRSPLTGLKTLFQRIRESRRYILSRYKYRTLGEYIADNWLKYRYGVMPLVGTIEGLMKTISDEKASRRFTARGYANATYAQQTSPVRTNTYTWSVATLQGNRKGSVSVRAGVLYEHTFSAGDRFGTNLSEVPSAAWELIPFSFVADWFVNVGNYIRALTPKAGVKVLSTWTTVAEELEYYSEESSAPRSVVNWTITDDRKGTQTTRSKITTRSPGVTAGLAIKNVTFDKKADWLHLADSFTLIFQLLNRR